MKNYEVSIVEATFEKERMFHADMLDNKKDRTLLWGYTCDRADFHVYMKYGEVHVYVRGGYNNVDNHVCKEEYLPRELVPDKRVYGEASDFEFCKLMREMGASFSFTSFNENREEKQYYGPVL